MQDLKKNKRRMNNKQISMMNSISDQELREEAVELGEEAVEMDAFERGCKCNGNNNCEEKHDKCDDKYDKHDKCDDKHDSCYDKCKDMCHDKCNDKHHNNKDNCGCEVESEMCSVNPCREECCNGIAPAFSTKNACPVAIETNRVFDSIQFRVFTDATGPNGQTLFFDYDVVQVRGNIPTRGLAKITVDEVCMNFSQIEITPGDVNVDDFVVTPVENNSPCDTVFESIVCPARNASCCAKNKGQNVLFRERGLTVAVDDLVLEIRGHCGRTKVVALAYPAVKRMGKLCRVDSVEFRFNTLASNICVSSSGRSITLRQNYLTSLAVDCISNAFISAEDCYEDGNNCDCSCDCDGGHGHGHGNDCDCECDCLEFTIPSGIDLILCVEETVSALIGDQIVVLAESNFAPRVVDTFANVCSFPNCGE